MTKKKTTPKSGIKSKHNHPKGNAGGRRKKGSRSRAKRYR